MGGGRKGQTREKAGGEKPRYRVFGWQGGQGERLSVFLREFDILECG
jgi:hypothetical protein